MQIVTPRQQSNNADLVVARIRQHGPKHKIEQLSLDQIPILTLNISLSTLIQKCKSLEYLSICGCLLSSLEAMPNLPNLQILELSQNKLQSEGVQPLAKYSKLYELALDSNRISNYNWVKFLKRSRITAISLSNNPIAADEDYRQKVYKALGADLQVLDGMDRAGRQVPESESGQSQSDSSDAEYSEMKEQERQAHSEGVSIEERRFDAQEGELPEKKVKKEEGDGQEIKGQE